MIEVVIAMAILGLLFIGFSTIFTAALRIQKSSNDITTIHSESATGIEERTGVTATDTIRIEFSLDSVVMDVSGDYYTSSNTRNTYKYFKPDTWNR